MYKITEPPEDMPDRTWYIWKDGVMFAGARGEEEAHRIVEAVVALEANNARLTAERDAARKWSRAWGNVARSYRLAYNTKCALFRELAEKYFNVQVERDRAKDEITRLRGLLNQRDAELTNALLYIAGLKHERDGFRDDVRSLRETLRDLVSVVEMDDDYAVVGSDEWHALYMAKDVLLPPDKRIGAEYLDPTRDPGGLTPLSQKAE